MPTLRTTQTAAQAQTIPLRSEHAVAASLPTAAETAVVPRLLCSFRDGFSGLGRFFWGEVSLEYSVSGRRRQACGRSAGGSRTGAALSTQAKTFLGLWKHTRQTSRRRWAIAKWPWAAHWACRALRSYGKEVTGCGLLKVWTLGCLASHLRYSSSLSLCGD